MLSSQLTDVQRTVRAEGKFSLLALRQSFPASVDRAWQALSTPEGLTAWFESVEGELVEGGYYALPGSGVSGQILRCTPPEALAVTWSLGDSTSVVEVTVAEDGAGEDAAVSVTLSHRIPRTMHWERFGAAAPGVGWDGAMAGLRGYLEGTLDQITSELGGLIDSSAGRSYIDALAASWAEAEVASGVKSRVAQRRAKESAKFYKNLRA